MTWSSARSPRVLLLLTIAGCAMPPATPPSHVGPVTGLALTSDGAYACSQAGVQTPTGWIVPPFRPTAIDVLGGRVLCGGGRPAESGEVAWFAPDGTALGNARVANDLVYAVAIHPNGTVAAIGCADGTVRLLDLPELTIARELTRHTAPCRAVRFSADGTHLASGGLDGLVYVHSLAGGEQLVHKDHTAGVECLLFDGDRIYSGARDGKVRIHAGNRFVRNYQGMRQPVLALTSDGVEVLAGLADGRVVALSPSDATFRARASIDGPLFTLQVSGDELMIGTTNGTKVVSVSR